MIYLLIAAGIFLLDYLCKEYMDRRLDDRDIKPVLGGRLLLRKLYNRGAMLGFMKNHRNVLTGSTLVLVGGVFVGWLRLLGHTGYGFLKLAGSFLVGGALSNLYDRIVRRHVIDYFSFGVKWKKLRQIVFNLSDMFIFVGAAMIVVWSLLKKGDGPL